MRVIPFEKPAPVRRVIIAWRKSFNRMPAIEAIRSAVSSLDLPGCKMLNFPPVSSVTPV